MQITDSSKERTRCVTMTSGSGLNEIYTLTHIDSGRVYIFYAINDDIPTAWAGRLKERTDVYDIESITYSYSNAGQVESITTSQGWAVEFTYDGTHERRTKVEVKDGSSTVVQEVNYTYYEDVTSPHNDVGSAGDLLAVEVKRRDSDESAWITRHTLYRYYRSGDSDGDAHQLKSVFEAEAVGTLFDSGTGAKGDKFKTEMYYDRNGRPVASEQINGMASEMAYDGAGRQYQSRTVTALETTKYSSGAYQYRAPVPEPDYGDLTGGDDEVITIAHSEFDGMGSVIRQYAIENHHDDTDGIDLTNTDDFIALYTFSWYDDVNRLTEVGNYGTANSGDDFAYAAEPTRPASAPASSDTILVTEITYDAVTGRQDEVTDPAGIVTKMYYDDLGRQTYVVENEDNFVASTEANTGDGSDTSKDRVTKFEYNGLNQITEWTALDADGNGMLTDNQATTYLYEDDYNASLNTNVIYPDSADTTSSGTDQVKMAYNVDGSLATKTDQNDTVITYTYTDDRMLEIQDVTTLSTADGHVRAIKTAYDDLDRPDTITSYATSGGSGTVRNQIVLTYNDLGQVTESEQSHEGAVSGSTPSVQYSYDLSSDGSSVYNDGARLDSVTYPGGEVINYHYNTAGSLDDLLSRLYQVRNSANSTRVRYLYNGLGRVVRADYMVPDLRLLYDGSDSDGDYEAFDRFGRIVDQRWRDYGAASDPDRFYYDHDRVANPDYRDIPTATYATNNKDQAFTYDGLHRLATFDTGTLSGSTISGTPATEQDFTLDQLGNWTGFVEKSSGTTDLNQSRTSNDANEIANITESTGPSWVTPVYDDNGNMTQGPQPGGETTNLKFICDAWNRLVEVTDNSDVTIARYEYDGLNRRIVKDDELADPDVDYDYFYNESWQIVEVRKNDDTDPLIKMVYHTHYIDAPAYRYYDANTDGTADEQYYSFDANFNVTALYDDTSTVLERYEYDAYGQVTILDADFSDDANNTSDYEQYHLFAGYRFDTESGLYEVRNRMLHPALGRWIQRDPVDYVDGMSVYQYAYSSPTAFVDQYGLSANCPPCPSICCNPVIDPSPMILPQGKRGPIFQECQELYSAERERCLREPSGSPQQKECYRQAEIALRNCNRRLIGRGVTPNRIGNLGYIAKGFGQGFGDGCLAFCRGVSKFAVQTVDCCVCGAISDDAINDYFGEIDHFMSDPSNPALGVSEACGQLYGGCVAGIFALRMPTMDASVCRSAMTGDLHVIYGSGGTRVHALACQGRAKVIGACSADDLLYPTVFTVRGIPVINPANVVKQGVMTRNCATGAIRGFFRGWRPW